MFLDDLVDKKVGILGFGLEGQAVFKYLKSHDISPVLLDKSRIEDLDENQKKIINSGETILSNFGIII